MWVQSPETFRKDPARGGNGCVAVRVNSNLSLRPSTHQIRRTKGTRTPPSGGDTNTRYRFGRAARRKSIARKKTRKWGKSVRFLLTLSLRLIHYVFNQCCELNLSVCSLQSFRKRVTTALVQGSHSAAIYATIVRPGPHTLPYETRAPLPPSGTQELMQCHACRQSGYTLPRQAR